MLLIKSSDPAFGFQPILLIQPRSQSGNRLVLPTGMYRPNIAIINKQRQRFKPVDPEIMPRSVFDDIGQKGLMLTSIIRECDRSG